MLEQREIILVFPHRPSLAVRGSHSYLVKKMQYHFFIISNSLSIVNNHYHFL